MLNETFSVISKHYVDMRHFLQMHHIGKILKMNHKCVQGEVISSQKMHSFQFHAKVPSTLITLRNAESLVHSRSRLAWCVIIIGFDSYSDDTFQLP